MQGCASPDEPSGNDVSHLTKESDAVAMTFPGWISEEQKKAEFEALAFEKSKIVCGGVASYAVEEVKSKRFGFSRLDGNSYPSHMIGKIRCLPSVNGSSPQGAGREKATVDVLESPHSNSSPFATANKNQPVGVHITQIQASVSPVALDGTVLITVSSSPEISSLRVNGIEENILVDGKHQIKRLARFGQETVYKLDATDVFGNTVTKLVSIPKRMVSVPETAVLTLFPERLKKKANSDAVAIIIGIQDYKRAPKADFANNDAKEFYEYAVRALGVKPEKIKILIDDEADEVNIVKAFENWLPIQVNKDKTEIYVFFSGHGLPAPDGNSLYFLPHGVDKELLSRTAVSQNDIVAALSAAKPKSVTMFIDACYSGQTRGGDVLVANAKPVSLKSDSSAYPPNFTVITASANDQISSSSPDLKHGIFSFYLMKGMEGEADANKDGKITVGEMQDYLSDMVARQAMTLNRKQTTQLFGDAGRVLVGK
jgi:hypothetical protein